MTDSRGDRQRRPTGPFLGASLLIHAVGLFLLLWSGALNDTRPEEQKDREKTPFEVSLVEESPPEQTQKEQPPRETPDKPKPSQPVPKQQTPPPPERRRRKTVEQETNEKQPEDARFRSDKANRVEEQTRARETTQQNVEPDREQGEAAEQEAEESQTPKQERAAAEQQKRKERQQRKEQRAQSEVPQKRPEPRAEEGEKEVPESQEKLEKLPMPTVSDYDELNEGSADREMARKEREKGAGHGMFERIEKSKGSLKASLENYITEVQPGNHTAVNATADAAASYISKIHRKIHPKWGGEYLPHLDVAYGPGHPLSDSDLNTVLEYVVDGDSGKLESVNVARSSGRVEFDAEAISVSKMVAPHPPAPPSVISPDGNVYLHWNFWRDQRQCGTFGVSIYKVDKEGSKEPVRKAPVDQGAAAQ
jgi:TonB family protein